MLDEDYRIVDDLPELDPPAVYRKLIAKSLRDAARYQKLLNEYMERRCGR